jgi:hypothetical protein
VAVELLEKQENDRVWIGRGAQGEVQRDADVEQQREIEGVRMEVQKVVKWKVEDISPLDEIVVSKKLRVGDQVEDELGKGGGNR